MVPLPITSLLTIDFVDGRLTYNFFLKKSWMELEMLDQHILSGSYLEMY